MSDPDITLTIRLVKGRIVAESLTARGEGATVEEALQQWINTMRAEHKRITDGLAKIEVPE